MKKTFLTLLVAGATAASFAQTKPAVKKAPAKPASTAKPKAAANPVATLKTTVDSTSYSFGASIGQSLKGTNITNFNYDILLKGIKDAMAGKPALTPAQTQTCINNAMDQAMKAQYGPAIAEGKAFLEQNKKRPGVQTTASGLQYEVLTAGTGAKPTETDSVLVHYSGKLINGNEFDSSYKRNEPITLTLDGVIRGWTEGLQLMNTGSKYRLFIPYTLGYGERGAGQDIPPYSTLIFDIELLKVNGK
ncbi:FKBP-type peptidyl-prolyl cis-trans isomerase [Pedobacter sp. MW01-1-1]|uniref:FKBP-type peptidyl-prolyl cis-trans isomerase n=1 Tax=Pedobacter sp. MW01-1-1 TaxID=3383027 RepID=UPI003FF019BA